MKTITLITVILLCLTFYSQAQIQIESADIIEVPQILSDSGQNVSMTGWFIFVMIDSIEYKLDSLSFDIRITDRVQGITTINNVNANWVQSISILDDSNTKEKYGYKKENGVIIIQLLDNHKQDFIDGSNVTKPLKFIRFSKQQAWL